MTTTATYTSILSAFDQITLDEMDNVKLMDRTDTKFVFNISLLPAILQRLQTYYRILNVNGLNINNYKTLYYDTDDFLFYRHHHNNKGNRTKVRHRTYLQSDLHFFEVKNKNNKNLTIKKRINTTDESLQTNEKALSFYRKYAIVNYADLKPKLWVYYSRITLVNKEKEERLTLDINLSFKNNSATANIENIVIAELKQGKKIKSIFNEIINPYSIRELSISKYCLGIINLYPNVKKNNFKPKLLTLKKISHEFSQI